MLEIGTGTGYNAALLAHRLGDHAVYSLDLDPGLVDAARDRLDGIGFHPHLTAGDGAAGWPGNATFDRIIAACAVSAIPPAWIDQLAPAGRIVAPLDAAKAGPLLVLDKTTDGEVSGIIDPYPVLFTPMRDRSTCLLAQGKTVRRRVRAARTTAPPPSTPPPCSPAANSRCSYGCTPRGFSLREARLTASLSPNAERRAPKSI
ncbi:methyltransferase domain-containing protein [Amycolatopsis sp. NPDC051071]|uniref:protein-L-isoaspartate O-methyltransferase family protein n=1 Tax=Amycolatopsis sp. NPDC051071 TaxID=3154637 RepID=UPI00341D1EFC